jgi:hypothetical protein
MIIVSGVIATAANRRLILLVTALSFGSFLVGWEDVARPNFYLHGITAIGTHPGSVMESTHSASAGQRFSWRASSFWLFAAPYARCGRRLRDVAVIAENVARLDANP